MKMIKFKPNKARFRASFAAGATNEPRLGNVDRENNVLHDVQITLEGEAKGHDVFLDREFCEAVAAAGNAMGDAGVKVRFGHPAMCSDALGTYLGRAKNFRVVDLTRRESGEAASGVLADVFLDANADRTEWILNMAESAPDTFGQSIVFTYGDLKVVDAAGVAHSYNAEVVEGEADPDDPENDEKRKRKTGEDWREQSADGRVFAVLGKLLGTDFTDTPAATDGVFSDTSLAAEAERILDENPQIADALENHPDNVYQFLARIGILDRIESKRVSGIQAEKDREVAALQKKLAEANCVVDSLKADLEKAESRAAAQCADAEKISELTGSLDAANTTIEQLRVKNDEGEKALAQVREQLDRLSKRHAEIIGGALNAVHPEHALRSAAEIQSDGSLSPAEKSKLLAAGKFKR